MVFQTTRPTERALECEGRLTNIGKRMKFWKQEAFIFLGTSSLHSPINSILNRDRLEAIQAELAKEVTSTDVHEMAQILRKQHQEEMNTLYDRVAEDYLGEAVDAYYSLDDTFTLPEIDVSHGIPSQDA